MVQKIQTTIKKFKEIVCKTCGIPCKSGKRGMCDKCYGKEQIAKARLKEKKEKKTLKTRERRIKKREAFTATKLWNTTSTLVRLLKPLECCTCNKTKETHPGVIFQAGHFLSRRFGSTKYDLRNMDPQCMSCNTFEGGHEFEHGIYIIRVYGEWLVNFIIKRARSNNFKLSTAFQKEIWELYKEYIPLAKVANEKQKIQLLNEIVKKYEKIYQNHKLN